MEQQFIHLRKLMTLAGGLGYPQDHAMRATFEVTRAERAAGVTAKPPFTREGVLELLRVAHDYIAECKRVGLSNQWLHLGHEGVPRGPIVDLYNEIAAGLPA